MAEYPCVIQQHQCFNVNAISVGDVLVVSVYEDDGETFRVANIDDNVIVGLVTDITASSVAHGIVSMELYGNCNMDITQPIQLANIEIKDLEVTYESIMTVMTLEPGESQDEINIPPEILVEMVTTYAAHQ